MLSKFKKSSSTCNPISLDLHQQKFKFYFLTMRGSVSTYLSCAGDPV